MRALAFRLRPRIRFPKFGLAPQLVGIGLVVAIVGTMAIEPTRQLIEQQERISGMESELSKLERSNDRLSGRIERLNDPDFIEQQARAQIGLIRPGEIPYLVLPPSKSVQKAKEKERAARAEPPPPPEPTFIEGLLDFIGL